MNNFFSIFTNLIAALGIILVIFELWRTTIDVRRIRHKKKNSYEDTIAWLQIFNNDDDIQHRATALMHLIKNSYILIHVIVNKGNNYDDKVQSEVFCNSLSHKRIDLLKNLESSNG